MATYTSTQTITAIPADHIINIPNAAHTVTINSGLVTATTTKLVIQGNGTFEIIKNGADPQLNGGFNIQGGTLKLTRPGSWMYLTTSTSSDADFFEIGDGGTLDLSGEQVGTSGTQADLFSASSNPGITVSGNATIISGSTSNHGCHHLVTQSSGTISNNGTTILDFTGGFTSSINKFTYNGTGDLQISGTVTVPSTATGVSVTNSGNLLLNISSWGTNPTDLVTDYFKTTSTGAIQFNSNSTPFIIEDKQGIDLTQSANLGFGTGGNSSTEVGVGHIIKSPITFPDTTGVQLILEASTGTDSGNVRLQGEISGGTTSVDDTTGIFTKSHNVAGHIYIYPEANITLPNNVLDIDTTGDGTAMYQVNANSRVEFNKVTGTNAFWLIQRGSTLDHELYINDSIAPTTFGFVKSESRKNIWHFPADRVMPTSNITFGDEFGGQFTYGGSLTYPDATIVRATGTITAFYNSWYQTGTRTTKTVIEVNENSYGRFVSTGSTDSFADGPLEFQINENLTSSATIFGSNLKLLDNTQNSATLNSGVGFDTPTVTGEFAGSFSVPTLSVLTSGDTNDILLNATHVAPVNEVQTVSYTWSTTSADNSLEPSTIDIGFLPGNRFIRFIPTNAAPYRNDDFSVNIDAINAGIKELVEANTNKLTFIGTTNHASNPGNLFTGSTSGYDGNIYLNLQPGITEADIPMTGTIRAGGLTDGAVDVAIDIPYTNRVVTSGMPNTVALAVDASVLTSTLVTSNPAPNFRNVLLLGDAQGPDWSVTAASVADLEPGGTNVTGNLVFTARSAGNKAPITFATSTGSAASVSFGAVVETTAGAGASGAPALLTTSYNAPTSNVATVSEGGSITITATGNLITDDTEIPYTISGLDAADFTLVNNKIQSYVFDSPSNEATQTVTFTLTPSGGGTVQTLTQTNNGAIPGTTVTNWNQQNHIQLGQILEQFAGVSSVDTSFGGTDIRVTFTQSVGDAVITVTTIGDDGSLTAGTVRTPSTSAGSLTGNLTYNSNTATQTFNIITDKVFSESESFIFTLNSPASGSVTVPITDTTFDVQTIKYTGTSVNTSGTPTSITLYKPDNTSETVSGITTSTSFANAITAVVNAIDNDPTNYGTVNRDDSFGSTSGRLYFRNFPTGITQADALAAAMAADVADIFINGVSLTTLVPTAVKGIVQASGSSEVEINISYNSGTASGGTISGISDGNSVSLAQDLDYSAESGTIPEDVIIGTAGTLSGNTLPVTINDESLRAVYRNGINATGASGSRVVTIGGTTYNNVSAASTASNSITNITFNAPIPTGITAGDTVSYETQVNAITITYTANNPTRQWAIKADNDLGTVSSSSSGSIFQQTSGSRNFRQTGNYLAFQAAFHGTGGLFYLNNAGTGQQYRIVDIISITSPAISYRFNLQYVGGSMDGQTVPNTEFQSATLIYENVIGSGGNLSFDEVANSAGLTPTYSFNSVTSIDEGATQNITLTTTGLANGTCIPYTITPSTGLSVTELGLTSLTGNFVVGSSNSVTIAPTADMLTESVTESFTLALDSVGGLIPTTTTGVITINDTSKFDGDVQTSTITSGTISDGAVFTITQPNGTALSTTVTATSTSTEATIGTAIAAAITASSSDVTGAYVAGTAGTSLSIGSIDFEMAGMSSFEAYGLSNFQAIIDAVNAAGQVTVGSTVVTGVTATTFGEMNTDVRLTTTSSSGFPAGAVSVIGPSTAGTLTITYSANNPSANWSITSTNTGTLSFGAFGGKIAASTYILTRTDTSGNPAVSEGNTFTITLSTTSVADGTVINYTVGGDVNSADYTASANTFTVGSVDAITFTVANDLSTGESNENFTIQTNRLGVSSNTISVAITDTSTGATDHTLTTGNNTFTAGTGERRVITGVFSGEGNIVKTGAGTLVLSGNNTFTGNIQVNEGAIEITNENSLGTVTTLTPDAIQLATGTKLINNATTKISLDANMGITLTGNSTIENSNETMDVLGNIVGTGNLTFGTGTNLKGTTRLRGTNNYTGTTTVNRNATLDINDANYYPGTTKSILTTTSLIVNGDLRGKGIVATNVVMNSGSNLVVGAEVGTKMIINGALTLNNGVNTFFSFKDVGGDTLEVRGNSTLAGTLNLVAFTNMTTNSSRNIIEAVNSSTMTGDFSSVEIHQNPDEDFITASNQFRDDSRSLNTAGTIYTVSRS